ncbi:MAG: glycerate kinase [Microbacterium sp.]|uniref:Glycerate 2-kinase n=1 Tax=Microbacterium ginsengisoli TaxID=400772 RepID=A0A0F0LWY8_9MICO|nr:glycerate kinase [Microbacterium ginsengisoli]KJL37204.1 Glycerate 2-kinase [Microbacterium ginsengisoli]MAL07939.1 glycerate kinase [Microbacterium sp.]MBN9209696.1 glycerate kinase [Microbacterium ginsengisoli]
MSVHDEVTATPLTVVVAPDSFKETLSAPAVADAFIAGWRSARPGDHLISRPMADGGEGTLDAIARAVPGSVREPVAVTGPDGARVESAWLRLPPTPDAPHGIAVVELAATSGLELLGSRRLPWDAQSVGFGEAIAAALDAGVSRLLLAVGGSASTDGGIGMLTALGARFTDAAGSPIARGARGLLDLAHVDLSGLRPLPTCGAVVLSDVSNPLLGERGAASVFGPQKGLDGEAIARVDAALARLGGLLPGDPDAAGAGAAGGVGFALRAWGATAASGAGQVARTIGLPADLDRADVVVTGEGSFDGQTAAGKAPAIVAGMAADRGVSALLVAGRLAADPTTAGFRVAYSLTDLAGSGEAARAEAALWVREAGRRAAATLVL